MSCNFNGSTQWIGNASSCPITNATTGATIACWANPSVLGNALINLSDSTGNSGALRLLSTSTGTRGTSITTGNIASIVDTTTGTPAVGIWGHYCATFTSASRSAFFNGSNKATTTATNNPTGFTRTQIGARRVGSAIDGFFNGLIAEVGIWNVVLSDEEVSSLADGISCSLIRPGSLVFYAPLIRQILDITAGFSLTNNGGATISDHTRIYL